jgi:hypothetical protein
VFHVSIVWTCVPERFLMKFHYATYIDIDTYSIRFRVRLGSRISDLRSSSLSASYIWVLFFPCNSLARLLIILFSLRMESYMGPMALALALASGLDWTVWLAASCEGGSCIMEIKCRIQYMSISGECVLRGFCLDC